MNSYVILLVLFWASQSIGQEVKQAEMQDTLKEDILKRISSPNDTLFEAEAKDVIAEYLVSTVLEDEILAFGRDREKEKGKPHHKPHKPHTDYRDIVTAASPIVSNNQQQQAVVASNPVVPVVQSVTQNSQSRQDVTQVPILTGAPVGSQQATAAPVQPVQPVAQPVQPIQTAAPVPTLPTLPPVTRPTVDPTHVYNQVDKILGSVATGNIVGIVDESLAIRAPTPVRNFVTGILKVIFCNPIDRLFGRCRPNNSGAISSVQGG